jgi:hypothetical protein
MNTFALLAAVRSITIFEMPALASRSRTCFRILQVLLEELSIALLSVPLESPSRS